VTTLAEVRAKYPQYSDMSDADLAGALHKKYYSDLPFEDFSQRIGLASPAAPVAEEPAAPSMLRRAANIPIGIGEAALSIGTGMVSTPINELIAGGVDALSQGIPGERTAEDVLANPPVGTYEPRTGVGRGILDYVGKVTAPIADALEWATDTDNPNPAVSATGHLINAGMGFAPGLAAGRRFNTARRTANAPTPTRDAIKAASQQAYAAAEKTGEVLPQSSLAGFIHKVESMLANEGADQALHPKTFTALNRLYEDATRPGIHGFSPKGAENTRKVLLNAETEAMASAAPGQVSSDARLAGKLLDDFDDFVEQSMPKTSTAGAAARELWARNLKAGEIETAFERAKNQAGQFSVSGMENALRTQFKVIADNPRRFRRFSAAEREAILKVVRGGPIQHALRLGGKLAPNGTVPIIAALTAEGAMPGAGLALAAVGTASRAGASKMRTAAALRVDDMVRRGGAKPGVRQSLPPATALERLGYIPANALALEEERKRSALK
jgi:hypothetical protein